jgi:hypothetical protein
VRLGFQKRGREARGGIGGGFYRGIGMGKGQRFERIRWFLWSPDRISVRARVGLLRPEVSDDGWGPQ